MRKIALLTILLLAIVARASHADYSVASYDKWNRLPSDTLNKRAFDYVTQKDMTDSALVCFTVLANRYFEGRHTESDIRYAMRAMTNLGILYMTHYYDYQKSYEFLLSARDLAESQGDDSTLPFIYNALANVLNVSANTAENDKEESELLRKAFQAAVKAGSQDVALTSFCNLFENAMTLGSTSIVTDELPTFEKMTLDNPRADYYRKLIARAARAFTDNDYSRAADYLRQAADSTWNASIYSRTQVADYMQAHKFYMLSGNHVMARQMLDRALSMTNDEGGKDLLPTVYQGFTDYYRQVGDSAKADRYLFLYYKADDAQKREGNVRTVPNVKLLHDLSVVNDEVKLLNQKRQLQQWLLVAALAVIVVVCLLLWRLFISYRRVNEAHYDLYLRNKQLLKEEHQRRQVIESLHRSIDELRHQNEQLQAVSTPAEPEEETAASQKDEELLQEIYARVIDFFENDDEIFSQGFTLIRLSERLQLRYHDVSQAINDQSGNNFNALLSSYRIKEACRRFTDTANYGHYSIKGIANSVGFKSRPNFVSLFKKQTGLSPSAYQKMARIDQGASSE